MFPGFFKQISFAAKAYKHYPAAESCTLSETSSTLKRVKTEEIAERTSFALDCLNSETYYNQRVNSFLGEALPDILQLYLTCDGPIKLQPQNNDHRFISKVVERLKKLGLTVTVHQKGPHFYKTLEVNKENHKI
jgi:hypothetical protein